MIAHVSPSHKHREETRNTLLYADKAKNISNKVTCIPSFTIYETTAFYVSSVYCFIYVGVEISYHFILRHGSEKGLRFISEMSK